MVIRRYKSEQIVNLLRRIEVGIANGKPAPQAYNESEITVQTTTAGGRNPRFEAGSGGIAHFRRLYCLKNFTIICEVPGG
jgi:hypothetical protein